MKKQFLKITFVFCLVLTLLSGCSSKNKNTKSEDTSETTSTSESISTSKNEFSNVSDLYKYLHEQYEEGNYSIEFTYTGNKEDISAKNLAKIVCAYYVSGHRKDQNYELNFTPYPGDNIVKAWRNGNESDLTDDEKQVYTKAKQIVADTKSSTSSTLELERALHDWICSNISYVDCDTSVDLENLNRPLTAVGALLDGQANCQGYTDTFYLLATLANFKVGRLSVDTNDNNGHMTNIICSSNQWYIVDTTHDDDDEKDYVGDYHLFNAGLDEIDGLYSWPEENTIHSIVQTGGDIYYYNSGLDGYQQNYSSLSVAAKGIVNAWYNDGHSLQYIRLTGISIDGSLLNDAIKSELTSRGIGCSWHTSSIKTDNNTFITVKLTAK